MEDTANNTDADVLDMVKHLKPLPLNAFEAGALQLCYGLTSGCNVRYTRHR